MAYFPPVISRAVSWVPSVPSRKSQSFKFWSRPFCTLLLRLSVTPLPLQYFFLPPPTNTINISYSNVILGICYPQATFKIATPVKDVAGPCHVNFRPKKILRKDKLRLCVVQLSNAIWSPQLVAIRSVPTRSTVAKTFMIIPRFPFVMPYVLTIDCCRTRIERIICDDFIW